VAPDPLVPHEDGNAREARDGTVPTGIDDKPSLAKSTCPEFAVEIIAE
jgi:ferredoxin